MEREALVEKRLYERGRGEEHFDTLTESQHRGSRHATWDYTGFSSPSRVQQILHGAKTNNPNWALPQLQIHRQIHISKYTISERREFRNGRQWLPVVRNETEEWQLSMERKVGMEYAHKRAIWGVLLVLVLLTTLTWWWMQTHTGDKTVHTLTHTRAHTPVQVKLVKSE